MKLYLETSVINFLFADDVPDKMRITKEFFKIINKFKIFISDIVLLEIESAPENKKQRLLEVVNKYPFKALKSSEEIEKIANIYMEANIIPRKFYNDALHIAIATKYEMDALVSWNLTHIVKLKTKINIREINKNLKLKEIIICTPEEII